MEKPIVIKKQELKKGKRVAADFLPSDFKKSIEKNKKALAEKNGNNSRTEFIEVE